MLNEDKLNEVYKDMVVEKDSDVINNKIKKVIVSNKRDIKLLSNKPIEHCYDVVDRLWSDTIDFLTKNIYKNPDSFNTNDDYLENLSNDYNFEDFTKLLIEELEEQNREIYSLRKNLFNIKQQIDNISL